MTVPVVRPVFIYTESKDVSIGPGPAPLGAAGAAAGGGAWRRGFAAWSEACGVRSFSNGKNVKGNYIFVEGTQLGHARSYGHRQQTDKRPTTVKSPHSALLHASTFLCVGFSLPPCGVCLLCGCRWFILYKQPLSPKKLK